MQLTEGHGPLLRHGPLSISRRLKRPPKSISVARTDRRADGRTDGRTDGHFITIKTKSKVKVKVTVKMVPNTPSSQDASTHQIWKTYLKEYRRYAPDTNRDGRTDSAITICLPKFLWGHKNWFDNLLIQTKTYKQTKQSKTVVKIHESLLFTCRKVKRQIMSISCSPC